MFCEGQGKICFAKGVNGIAQGIYEKISLGFAKTCVTLRDIMFPSANLVQKGRMQRGCFLLLLKVGTIMDLFAMPILLFVANNPVRDQKTLVVSFENRLHPAIHKTQNPNDAHDPDIMGTMLDKTHCMRGNRYEREDATQRRKGGQTRHIHWRIIGVQP